VLREHRFEYNYEQYHLANYRITGSLRLGLGLVDASLSKLAHQVENHNFVAEHDIGLFVVAAGIQYDNAGNVKKPWHHVVDNTDEAVAFLSVAHKPGRCGALDAILPRVMEVLGTGQAVCIHCENSFHRGPLALVAVVTAITGHAPDEVMQWLSEQRNISRTHTAASLPDPTDWAAESLVEIRKVFLEQIYQGRVGHVPQEIMAEHHPGDENREPPTTLPQRWC
jgi:hypothetical protein